MRSLLAIALGLAVLTGPANSQAQSRVAVEGQYLADMSSEELLRIRAEASAQIDDLAHERRTVKLKQTATTAAGLAMVGVGFATATFGVGCLIAGASLGFMTFTSTHYQGVLEKIDGQSLEASRLVS